MARLISASAAAIGLILAIPVMAAIALGVAVTMGRPVLFHQDRAGLDGKRFQMLKFRSMRDIRDEAGRPLPDAARITPFGRFLRRSRLDELPELVNILRDEMAWIGPRPLLPETIEALGEPGMRRCRVRPGLTGWSQVNGNALLTNEEKLALDLWYVENRNLYLNTMIILLTVRVMLVGERVNLKALEKCRAGYPCRSS
jgi:lipopolysaccharide/colanic/teichoic acid biosynthesis glycosyltransferase